MLFFFMRGENWSNQRKTSRSRVENQQTQPTYDAKSGNRTRDTLVESEHSHHCANPAPLLVELLIFQLCAQHAICWNSLVHGLVGSHTLNLKIIAILYKRGKKTLFKMF